MKDEFIVRLESWLKEGWITQYEFDIAYAHYICLYVEE